MNRKILEIDSEIARLREEVSRTQDQIQTLAEERGLVLARLENDTKFRRKIRKDESGNKPDVGA